MIVGWMIAHDRVNQFPGCRRIEHYSQRKSMLTSKVTGPRAMDRGPVSRVRLYSVAQQPDGMVVAIAEITTVKCLYPGSKDPYSSSSDYYRMILTPSQEGYVVLQDSSIGNPVRERLPEGFHSLYHNTVKKPECAST